jgi:hypothetical protein
MSRIVGAALLAMVLLAGWGCGGSGSMARPGSALSDPPPRATAVEAAGLVDRQLHSRAAKCAPAAGLRFHCQLDDLEGSVDIGLTSTGGKFAILGCESATAVCVLRNPSSAGTTVARESPAARHAAGLLDDGFVGLSHVTCSRVAIHFFDCDSLFREEGMRNALNLDLSIEGRFHFMSDCRITKVFVRDAGPFACQHLSWNLNFPQSEIQAMAHETLRVEGPKGR